MNRKNLSLTLLFLLLLIGPGRLIAAGKDAQDGVPPSRAIPSDSGLFPAAFQKSAQLFCAGEYDHSLAQMTKQGKKLEKKYPAPYYQLHGLNYFQLHNFAAAAESFSKSRSARRSNSDTLYLLGVSLYQLGKQKEAMNLLEEAVWFKRHTIIPPEIILERLAITYLNLGLQEKASAAYQQALRIAPDFAAAKVGLARVQIEEGKGQQASILLKQAAILAGKKQEEEKKKSVEAAAPSEEQEEAITDQPACPLNTVREMLFHGQDATPAQQLLFARLMLSDTTVIAGKNDLQATVELSEALFANESLPAPQRVEAGELLVLALLRTDRVSEAKQALSRSGEKFPGLDIWSTLQEQIQIHETALNLQSEAETSLPATN